MKLQQGIWHHWRSKISIYLSVCLSIYLTCSNIEVSNVMLSGKSTVDHVPTRKPMHPCISISVWLYLRGRPNKSNKRKLWYITYMSIHELELYFVRDLLSSKIQWDLTSHHEQFSSRSSRVRSSPRPEALGRPGRADEPFLRFCVVRKGEDLSMRMSKGVHIIHIYIYIYYTYIYIHYT